MDNSQNTNYSLFKLIILKYKTKMDRYKETFETWDKMASLYCEKFMDMQLYNATYDYVLNTIVKNKAQILDLGCGPGNITKYMLSKRPDYKICGIDIAPNMIGLAEKNNPTAVFKNMDARQIRKLNTIFDGIICGFCLPYLSQRECENLISDIYQLLKDDGLIYLSFVEGDPKKSGFISNSGGSRVYFYFHSLENIEALLLKNNFKDLKIWKVEYKISEKDMDIHTVVTAKKNCQ